MHEFYSGVRKMLIIFHVYVYDILSTALANQPEAEVKSFIIMTIFSDLLLLIIMEINFSLSVWK